MVFIKKLEQGHQVDNIHDLLSLKVMVDNIANCYYTLGLVHSKYHPINNKFKDYISTLKQICINHYIQLCLVLMIG